MKKTIIFSVLALFVMSAAVFAENAKMPCGKTAVKGGMCAMENCLCMIDADFSVENTKDGAIIKITAKKGGTKVQEIQNKLKDFPEMRAKCMMQCRGKK